MISAEYQNILRNKFNPDGSELRNMQLRMLEMLKYIDTVCRENNIKYWLSSGTCLGAIRHKGFIPWDDDADIEMLEEDYNKLKKILKESNPPYYVFQDENSDPDYLQRFDKLRDLNSEVKEDANTDKWNNYKGCYVDIFVLQSSISKKFHWFWGHVWNYSLFPLVGIKNKKLRRVLIKFIRRTLKFSFSTISLFKPKTDIYRHALGSGFNGARHRNDFEHIKYVDFEDTKLPVPANYDDYLKRLYGQYMDIPPLEKIHTHFKAARIY